MESKTESVFRRLRAAIFRVKSQRPPLDRGRGSTEASEESSVQVRNDRTRTDEVSLREELLEAEQSVSRLRTQNAEVSERAARFRRKYLALSNLYAQAVANGASVFPGALDDELSDGALGSRDQERKRLQQAHEKALHTLADEHRRAVDLRDRQIAALIQQVQGGTGRAAKAPPAEEGASSLRRRAAEAERRHEELHARLRLTEQQRIALQTSADGLREAMRHEQECEVSQVRARYRKLFESRDKEFSVLRDKLAAVEPRLATLSDRLATETVAREEAERRRARGESRLTALEARNLGLEEQVRTLEAHESSWEDASAALQAQVDALVRECDDVRRQCEAEVAVATLEASSAQQALAHRDTRIRYLEDNREKLARRIPGPDRRAVEPRSDVGLPAGQPRGELASKVERRSTQLEEQITSLRERCVVQAAELERAAEQRAELLRQIDEQRIAFDGHSRVAEARRDAAKKAASSLAEARAERIVDLERAVSELQEKLRSATSQLEHSTTASTAAVSAAEAERDRLSGEIARLKSSAEAQRALLGEAERRAEELAGKLNGAAAARAGLTARAAKVEQQFADERAAAERSAHATAARVKALEELAARNEEVLREHDVNRENARARVAALEAELLTLQNDLQARRHEDSVARQAVASLEGRNAELQRRALALRIEGERAADLATSRALELEQDVARLSEELRAQLDANAKVRASIAEVEAERGVLVEASLTLTSTERDQRDFIAKAEQKAHELGEKLARAQTEAVAAVAAREARIAELEQAAAIPASRIHELEHQAIALRAEAERATESAASRVRELKQEIARLSEDLRGQLDANAKSVALIAEFEAERSRLLKASLALSLTEQEQRDFIIRAEHKAHELGEELAKVRAQGLAANAASEARIAGLEQAAAVRIAGIHELEASSLRLTKHLALTLEKQRKVEARIEELGNERSTLIEDTQAQRDAQLAQREVAAQLESKIADLDREVARLRVVHAGDISSRAVRISELEQALSNLSDRLQEAERERSEGEHRVAKIDAERRYTLAATEAQLQESAENVEALREQAARDQLLAREEKKAREEVEATRDDVLSLKRSLEARVAELLEELEGTRAGKSELETKAAELRLKLIEAQAAGERARIESESVREVLEDTSKAQATPSQDSRVRDLEQQVAVLQQTLKAARPEPARTGAVTEAARRTGPSSRRDDAAQVQLEVLAAEAERASLAEQRTLDLLEELETTKLRLAEAEKWVDRCRQLEAQFEWEVFDAPPSESDNGA